MRMLFVRRRLLGRRRRQEGVEAVGFFEDSIQHASESNTSDRVALNKSHVVEEPCRDTPAHITKSGTIGTTLLPAAKPDHASALLQRDDLGQTPPCSSNALTTPTTTAQRDATTKTEELVSNGHIIASPTNKTSSGNRGGLDYFLQKASQQRETLRQCSTFGSVDESKLYLFQDDSTCSTIAEARPKHNTSAAVFAYDDQHRVHIRKEGEKTEF